MKLRTEKVAYQCHNRDEAIRLHEIAKKQGIVPFDDEFVYCQNKPIDFEDKYMDWGDSSYYKSHNYEILKASDVLEEYEEAEIEFEWSDVLDHFYCDNDGRIEEWSKNKRLILEFRDWLVNNYHVPKQKTPTITPKEAEELLKELTNKSYKIE